MSGPAQHFANELRLARDAAGWSQEALAGAVNYSPSLVAMIERCARQPSADFARAVDDALQTGGRFDRMRQDLLVPEVRPEWFKSFLDFEREASHIRTWEPILVPGLLQTAEYARALLRDEDHVAARLERQQIRDRAELTTIIDESVLERRVGNADTMRHQLESLAGVVHVLPRTAETYLGVDGGFVLATVDGSEVGYTDTPLRGYVAIEQDVTSALRQRFETLAAEALPRSLSERMIGEAIEQWKS